MENNKKPIAFIDEYGYIIIVGKDAFKNTTFVDIDRAFPDSWKPLAVNDLNNQHKP